MEGVLVQRSDKVAFYGITSGTGEAASTTYYRMQGFTELATSKNPKEYARQYVDEAFEQTDVTGYSPAIAYAFDCYRGNAVHEDIAQITNEELLGNEAVRSILLVDLTAEGTNAMARDFAVIPDSEGGSLDAYTYSGNFKVKGAKVAGTAVLAADGLTATFTPSEAGA